MRSRLRGSLESGGQEVTPGIIHLLEAYKQPIGHVSFLNKADYEILSLWYTVNVLSRFNMSDYVLVLFTVKYISSLHCSMWRDLCAA